MSSAPSTTGRRERRPTARAQYIVETQKDRDDRQLQQAIRAKRRQDKEALKADKAAEREAYQNCENTGHSNIDQSLTTTSGRDPAFASQMVVTPVHVKRVVLAPRKGAVPPAPKSLPQHQSMVRPTPQRDLQQNSVVPPAPAQVPRNNTHHTTAPSARPQSGLQHNETVTPATQRRPRASNANVQRFLSPADSDLFDDAIGHLATDFDIDGGPDIPLPADITVPEFPALQDDGDDDHSPSQGNEDSSSSPSVGEKRHHEGSVSDDDEPFRKAVKIQQSRGRPKAADYEPSVRTILGMALSLYRGRLCNDDPMPDRMLEITWAKAAWNEACKRCKTSIAYDAEIIGMITCRSPHLRGEVISKIRPYVADEYGFKSSTKQSVIDRNIMLSRELKKDFSFVCETRNPNSNFYGAEIIQKGINAIWFHDKKDEGVRFPECYKPFPEVGLALLLTAIECCIDEWSSGAQTNKKFTVEEYQDVLAEHLNALADFDKFTKAEGLVPRLLSSLHDNGR